MLEHTKETILLIREDISSQYYRKMLVRDAINNNIPRLIDQVAHLVITKDPFNTGRSLLEY